MSGANRIVWRHGGIESAFSQAQCPIVIGTVSAADIRISGPGGQTVAQIDLVDGKPFIQPLLRPSPLELDGERLSTTRSLVDGQRLSVFGVALDVHIDVDSMTLSQDSGGSRFETAPPIVQQDDEDIPLQAADWQPGRADVVAPTRPVAQYLVLSSVLVVLLAAVAWLVTAVPVRIDTSPTEVDVIDIDGPGFALPLGDRVLLRSGVHDVHLITEGYQDLTRRIEVDRDTTTIVLEQQPLPGTLVVRASAGDESVEARARLSAAAGKVIETLLPATFSSVPPGRYDLQVSADQYLDFVGQIEVVGLGQTQQLDVALVPSLAELTLISQPAGAAVIALEDNRTLTAATPALVQLPSGLQKLRFELPGYKPLERVYRVFPNTSQNIEPVVLEPADATLVVRSSPRGASVTVDGRFMGRTPLTLALEPRRDYALKLTAPGYASATRRARLSSGQQSSLSVALDAQLGEVTIRTVPVDATIFVNGRDVGKGTVTLQLPAEPQTVTVKRRGYAEWTRRVTPRPGFTQTLDATLLTPQQIADAKIEQEIDVANGHKLQYVRAGTFQMGSSRREPERRSNEALRDARVTQAFYISQHEVSNRQFAAYRRAHERGGSTYPSIAGDDNPVVNVSWQDAAAYCNWLSSQEQRTPAYVGEFGKLVPATSPTNGYRLPTEAQWSWVARYAATSGQPRRYGWGADLPPPKEQANIADETAKKLLTNVYNGYNDSYPATAPVGSFKANALGIYDLDGNVSEWVQDRYVATFPDGPLIDPLGPTTGDSYVIRGPGWRDANPQQLRLAYRDFGSEPALDVGFRIVRPVR